MSLDVGTVGATRVMLGLCDIMSAFIRVTGLQKPHLRCGGERTVLLPADPKYHRFVHGSVSSGTVFQYPHKHHAFFRALTDPTARVSIISTSPLTTPENHHDRKTGLTTVTPKEPLTF